MPFAFSRPRDRSVIARLLVTACLAWSSKAGAQELSPTAAVTVVIAPPATPALQAATRVVAAELTSAGYRLSQDCAPAVDPGCGASWPDGARAVAGLGFTWASDGLAIEARVVGRDRRSVRLEALVAGAPVPEPAVVAVRATELVRAGVLAVLRGPEPPAELEKRGFFVALGPGLLQSVGGLGGGFGPSLRAGLTWRGSWFAGAWLVPSLGRSASTPDGSAQVRDDLLGGELGWRWRVSPVIQPALAVGAGAYHLRVVGKEVAPLSPAAATFWTPFLSAGAGAVLPLSAHWELEADLRAAFTHRAAAVHVGASEAGHTGWPVLAASVAVGYWR
jgi:hypothetical protein